MSDKPSAEPGQVQGTVFGYELDEEQTRSRTGRPSPDLDRFGMREGGPMSSR